MCCKSLWLSEKATIGVASQAAEKRDMIPTLCEKDYNQKLSNITAEIWDKLFMVSLSMACVFTCVFANDYDTNKGPLS